jgi:hypothetical protein
MKGKPWLWIVLAVAALLSVCCCGAVIGATLARRNEPFAQATQNVASQPPAAQPTTAPTEPPTEPVPPAPTATLVPTLTPPPPTATAVPIPPPPAAPPSAPPADSELQALVDYANAMQPLLDEATILVQRDGEILQASEGGNDAVLCDGQLVADKETMAGIVRRVRALAPPADAGVIHDLILQSGDAWTEALDNVGQFCSTGNHLYKVPAVLKFAEAAATLRDAGNRFWLLLLAKGVEDWVQR